MAVSGRRERNNEGWRQENEKYQDANVATVGMEWYGIKLKVRLNEEMEVLMRDSEYSSQRNQTR